MDGYPTQERIALLRELGLSGEQIQLYTRLSHLKWLRQQPWFVSMFGENIDRTSVTCRDDNNTVTWELAPDLVRLARLSL